MSAIRFRAACVSVAALVALIGDVTAQQPTPAQQNAIRQSCRNDFQAMCAGVQPGGSDALQCLQQNAAKVSSPCRQALSVVGGGGGSAPANAASTAGTAGATAPAAAAPMQQQGMQPQGTQPQGMQAQQGGMGKMSMRDEFRLTREACGPDYRIYCQRVQPGGGRALTCLEANAASLSPGCQKALMAMKQQMGK